MPEIRTPDCHAFHYRRYGSGPALVLLHGFPSDGTLWQDVVTPLADHFLVLVPDLPGAGESILDGPTDMTAMARCVAAMLEQEKLGRAVIAGHSMGGYVALAFARIFPAITAGLSLVHSTPAPDDDERKQIRRKAIQIIQKGGKKAFILQMVPNLFGETFKRAEPGMVERTTDHCLMISEEAMVNFYEAMIAREDSRPFLRDVPFPLQWIMGDEDILMPIEKSITNSYLSDRNFVEVYNSVGHMSMVEDPHRLVTSLLEFARYCYRD